MAVELDANAFKALSSERRVEILKALSKKPRSLTSLAHELKLSVQATDEHLRKLESAGLVQKSKHAKWTYYALDAKGAALLAPNRQPVYVLLSISILLLAAAGLTWLDGDRLVAYAAQTGVAESKAVAQDAEPLAAAAPAEASDARTAEIQAESAPTPSGFPWAYALGFSGFAFLLAAVIAWHRQNQN
ncbi:winged helix-turn-helix transcriptional regulator [Candidatus Micrarchaeota archaeon]|nr:winged helix-turn-helix transcriptional regulator [Candidatus Micrarchaeota archaeon]